MEGEPEYEMVIRDKLGITVVNRTIWPKDLSAIIIGLKSGWGY
jgi:hypothetical protein